MPREYQKNLTFPTDIGIPIICHNIVMKLVNVFKSSLYALAYVELLHRYKPYLNINENFLYSIALNLQLFLIRICYQLCCKPLAI